MGGGISMNFANVGIPVTIIETEQGALDRGLGIVEKNYAATVSKGRLSQKMDQRMALLSGALDLTAAYADIVIEAVFENMALKKRFSPSWMRFVSQRAFLPAIPRPWMSMKSPVSPSARKMLSAPFLQPRQRHETVGCARREDRRRSQHNYEIGQKIQKVPVVVGVCDGFVGNRMLHAYTRQAGFLIEDGALLRMLTE